MAVSGVYGIVLEVPNLEDGREFYSAAGLEVQEQQDRLVFTCKGQERAAITLIRGAGKKRLHHIILTSDDLSFDLTKENVIKYGGTVVAAPEGFEENGLWIKDPHGLLVHLITGAPETPLSAKEVFEINQPGRTIRIDKAAVTPKSKTPKILPLRLGHIMLFTPNTMKSVEFFSEALGMGLADRAQDTVAFMCARKNSDHHVVAFAESPDVGFHHASFQVETPDEVGIAGRRLINKLGVKDWGFGRHTIGSNFFHYIQDPWGSWMEYYADMDFISDYSEWSPSIYDMEDSLEKWGPPLPHDFVHNYECDPSPYVSGNEGR